MAYEPSVAGLSRRWSSSRS